MPAMMERVGEFQNFEALSCHRIFYAVLTPIRASNKTKRAHRSKAPDRFDCDTVVRLSACWWLRTTSVKAETWLAPWLYPRRFCPDGYDHGQVHARAITFCHPRYVRIFWKQRCKMRTARSSLCM